MAVKIIKQFSDPEYWKRFSYLCDEIEIKTGWWIWRLGDDGCIYASSSDFSDYGCKDVNEEWYPQSVIPADFKMMKRFLKEFGHLLLWL